MVLSTYEAILVKACSAQALVFIFTGSDRDAVNNLIGATQVKIDLVVSTCGPAAIKSAGP